MLYIFEFSREDSENEAEWFVGEVSWDYKTQEENAYKHLLENIYDDDGYSLDDVKELATVEGVFGVNKELIKEVHASYKGGE